MRYCCQAGLSRLYLAFRLATICGATAFSLSHGPPGVMCMSVNVISDTNSRTGISHRMRRAMNRVIGVDLRVRDAGPRLSEPFLSAGPAESGPGTDRPGSH